MSGISMDETIYVSTSNISIERHCIKIRGVLLVSFSYTKQWVLIPVLI